MKTSKKKNKYIAPEINVAFSFNPNMVDIIATSAPMADPSVEMESRRFDISEDGNQFYDFFWKDTKSE